MQLRWTALLGCAFVLTSTPALAGSASSEKSLSTDSLYDFATASELAEEQVFLAEIEQIEPDPESWYILKKVDVPDLEAARASFEKSSADIVDSDVEKREQAEADEYRSDDLSIMALPDGRTYKQHWWTWDGDRAAKGMGASTRSVVDSGEPLDANTAGDSDLDPADPRSLAAQSADDRSTLEKQIIGTDGRRRTTSAAAGHRGVTVRLQTTASANRGFCSGAMISPRVVLTAAHCITDDNGDLDKPVVYVAPGARGASYAGTKMPQGARRVERFHWPSGWTGHGGSKYDYAMLVLSDLPRDSSGSIRWEPTPALVGYQTESWLESKYFNLRGYPGASLDCADAAPGDGGTCGGYAYGQYPAKMFSAVFSTWIRHTHDTQGGQSGAPIYHYDNGVRTIFGVHSGTYGSSYNRAHKVRSGSFHLMCQVLEGYPSSHFTNYTCN